MTPGRWLPVGACLVGIFVVFRDTLFSGGMLQLSDAGDPRFNEFLLEHSWRWLRGETAGGFFDLPMAYPLGNTLAYSEPMVSFGPLYWPFRAMGLSAPHSYSWWLVAMAVANFFSFYVFMRKALKHEPLSASIAAFLFAFGLPRVAQIGHSQLWPQPYVVLVLWGMFALLFDGTSKRVRRWAVAAVVTGLVLQAWGCLYNAIFIGYACLAAGVFAVVHPAWRAQAWRTLRETGTFAAVCVAVGAVLLLPLAQAYLAVYATVPDWDPRLLAGLQPRPGSLLYVWGSSWFYAWMTTSTPLGGLPALNEQALGMGLLTSVVVLLTLFRHFRQPVVHLLVFLVVVLWLPTVLWPGGHSAWFIVREWIPGWGALRAISRLGILFLIPASIALGVFVAGRSRWRWPGVCTAIALLCVVEQGTEVYSWPREPYEDVVDKIVENVDPDAEAFYYVGAGVVPSWYSHIDAILAAQRAGVPTVNMFSGKYPSAYEDLRDNVATNAAMRQRIDRGLDHWIQRQGLSPDRIQRIDQTEIWQVPAAVNERAVP